MLLTFQKDIYYLAIMIPNIMATSCLFLKLMDNNEYDINRNQLINMVLSIVLLGIIVTSLSPYLEDMILYYPHNSVHKIMLKSSQNMGEKWYSTILVMWLFMRYYYSRKLSQRVFLFVMDNIAISVCLGIVIGKIACFMSGHDGCYGKKTDLPWGMIYNNEYGSSLVAVHPSQLYLSFLHLLLLFVLLRLKKENKVKNGIICFWFLLLTSLFNICIEFINTNLIAFWGMTLGQLTYITLIISVLFYFFKIERKELQN